MSEAGNEGEIWQGKEGSFFLLSRLFLIRFETAEKFRTLERRLADRDYVRGGKGKCVPI